MRMRPVTAWGLLVIQFGGILLAAVVSLAALHSARESERARLAAEAAREQASRQNAAVVCSMIVAQDEVTNDPDNPPPTERARNAAAAWRNLRDLWC